MTCRQAQPHRHLLPVLQLSKLSSNMSSSASCAASLFISLYPAFRPCLWFSPGTMDTTHENWAASRSQSDDRSARNLSRVIRRVLHRPQYHAENHDTIVTSQTLGNRIRSQLIKQFTKAQAKDHCPTQSRLAQTQGDIFHSHDDGDLAKEQRLPTGSEEELCPKGSVPLHRLCDRCWQTFDILQDAYTWFEKSPNERGFKPRELESCTLADLVKGQKSCHFCAIVCSVLEDDVSLPSYRSVTFELKSYVNGPQPELDVYVWVEDTPKDFHCIPIRSFECELYPTPFQ